MGTQDWIMVSMQQNSWNGMDKWRMIDKRLPKESRMNTIGKKKKERNTGHPEAEH